jgi:serine/threonine protein phosphatase 1
VTTRAAFIGDVHGQRDKLACVFDRLRPTDRAIVLLGDYVNYGPDSRGVLDLLVAERTALGDQLVLLAGNHDEAFLTFLNGGDLGSLLALGGAPTVMSYLGNPVGPVSDRFRVAVPSEHRALLAGLELCWRSPGVMAMHRWPKEPISGSDYVVLGHYHQPGGQPAIGQKVAYIDTECGRDPAGKLTCLLFPELDWFAI